MTRNPSVGTTLAIAGLAAVALLYAGARRRRRVDAVAAAQSNPAGLDEGQVQRLALRLRSLGYTDPVEASLWICRSFYGCATTGAALEYPPPPGRAARRQESTMARIEGIVRDAWRAA